MEGGQPSTLRLSNLSPAFESGSILAKFNAVGVFEPHSPWGFSSITLVFHSGKTPGEFIEKFIILKTYLTGQNSPGKSQGSPARSIEPQVWA